MGRADVAFMDDDWTVVTDDGSLAAHYEKYSYLLQKENRKYLLWFNRKKGGYINV